MEVGIGGREMIDDGLDLGHRSFHGLAGNGPALDLHGALRGVGAESGPAGEQGRMQRWRTNERVRPARAQVALESRERVQEGTHFQVRVDTQLEPAAVGGTAGDGHVDPQVAFVGDAGVERGGLGEKSAVGADVAEQVHRAEAAVLFVGHTGQNHVAGQTRTFRGQGADSRHTGSDAAFHVVGAATIHTAVADRGGERVRHALHADRVDVADEHQAAAAAGAGQPGDSGGPTGLGFENAGFEAAGADGFGDEAGNRSLARAGRSQRGIDAFDLNEAR